MSRKKHARPDGDEDVKIYPDEPPLTSAVASRANRGARRYTQTRAVKSGDGSAGAVSVSGRPVDDRRAGAEQNQS